MNITPFLEAFQHCTFCIFQQKKRKIQNQPVCILQHRFVWKVGTGYLIPGSFRSAWKLRNGNNYSLNETRAITAFWAVIHLVSCFLCMWRKYIIPSWNTCLIHCKSVFFFFFRPAQRCLQNLSLWSVWFACILPPLYRVPGNLDRLFIVLDYLMYVNLDYMWFSIKEVIWKLQKRSY